MVPEAVEDVVSDLAVFFQSHGEDKNVVQVNCDFSCGNEVGEDGVHQGLEGGGRVGETKEHDLRFEEALVGRKGGFPLISLLDADIVVSPTYVELGEVLGSFKTVNDVGDEGKWVAILDRELVEAPVVLYEAEFAILLLHKEDRRGKR